MRNTAVIFLALGVCLRADEPSQKILVLKSGQRIIYDEISREGTTLFVRIGGQSVMIDAADVAPAPVIGVAVQPFEVSDMDTLTRLAKVVFDPASTLGASAVEAPGHPR